MNKKSYSSVGWSAEAVDSRTPTKMTSYPDSQRDYSATVGIQSGTECQ